MKLIKKPITGMRDILPQEMEVRDYVLGLVKETYRGYGFSGMDTPCVEHIENLCSKQGGDNEKLIFKILKRGEKLKLQEAKREEEVVDGGLRYDLTLPLARYYANHSNELPSPFKAMQMGYVWRADRPQKGRYRQFMQCDIDILGEASNLAEIELILATTELLGKLEFKGFTLCLNDREILKEMASFSGFQEEDFEGVFIILDKLDKIGFTGVKDELEALGYEREVVEGYLSLFQGIEKNEKGLETLLETLGEQVVGEASNRLLEVISSVKEAKTADFQIVFDPTLVRGQGYYTGTIFEIRMDSFGGSVAGGGRYDKMIGRFTGQDVAACGFSIGFERIVLLLLEKGFQVPWNKKKKAYLLEKNISQETKLAILKQAQTEREAGHQVLITYKKKNGKFQKLQLKEEGYEEIQDCYEKESLR